MASRKSPGKKSPGKKSPGRKSPATTRSRDFSREALLDYIRNQPERSAGFRHILEDFSADKTDRKQIKDILDQLVKEDKLSRHKGNRFEAPAAPSLYRGRISIHPDGYGFVTPEENIPGLTGDIFIPPPKTGSSMDGDYVGVAITSPKKAEGRVVRVEERARTKVVGQLRYDGRVYFLSPADEKLPDRILIKGEVSEHKDKIIEIELTRFGSESVWPAGELVSVLGFIDDPDVETSIIIKKYGLAVEFPEAVEKEVSQLPLTLTDDDIATRDDFRDRTTLTIDPATARDFDDAIDVEQLADGGFRLGVHIADVAHFVPPGSATDNEARERSCSVYFPDRVVPMLPERLSNDICSLNPRTARLTMSVVLDIGSDGTIRAQSFHNSVIRSDDRMDYETVQKILDGDGPLRKRHRRIVGTIELLEKVARLLLDRRSTQGTIGFDLPEPELTYDEEGRVEGVVKAEQYFSHRMIEQFMVAANEAVARLLETEMPATIFRVHERPDAGKVSELSDTLATLGVRFRPRKLTPRAFQQFLVSMEGRPDARMISFLVLRSFKQAVYSTGNAGHFGLASVSYTHFTSPIRRYPDLVVHRLLKAFLSGRRRSGYSLVELDAMAATSSRRERIVAQAERDLYDWKRMTLLEQHLGDTLDAIIISVWGKGIRVELVDYFIEGLVSVDDMVDDYYDFDARSHTLSGRGTRRKYRLGQRLRVQVARVDKLLGRAYFLPALAKGKQSD